MNKVLKVEGREKRSGGFEFVAIYEDGLEMKVRKHSAHHYQFAFQYVYKKNEKRAQNGWSFGGRPNSEIVRFSKPHETIQHVVEYPDD